MIIAEEAVSRFTPCSNSTGAFALSKNNTREAGKVKVSFVRPIAVFVNPAEARWMLISRTMLRYHDVQFMPGQTALGNLIGEMKDFA